MQTDRHGTRSSGGRRRRDVLTGRFITPATSESDSRRDDEAGERKSKH